MEGLAEAAEIRLSGARSPIPKGSRRKSSGTPLVEGRAGRGRGGRGRGGDKMFHQRRSVRARVLVRAVGQPLVVVVVDIVPRASGPAIWGR